MRRSVDIGTWRSHLGDTWPHSGIEVERDWWPQSTHLVWEPDPLVVCATGAGGGSQQAMFRRELDPLLAGALVRWQGAPRGMGPHDDLDQLFSEIQRGFELLEESYRDELQASAVALLVDDDRAAIAHVGMERAWRVRHDRLVQLTEDDTIGKHAGPTVQDWVNRLPASWLGRRGDEVKWTITDADVREGDVFVLMAGVRNTGFELAELPSGSAQAIADELGKRAFDQAGEDERWHVGSRLAIAVVTV